MSDWNLLLSSQSLFIREEIILLNRKVWSASHEIPWWRLTSFSIFLLQSSSILPQFSNKQWYYGFILVCVKVHQELADSAIKENIKLIHPLMLMSDSIA